MGSESAQFIIDNLLRFSFKRMSFSNDFIHELRKRIATVDHNLGQPAANVRITRQDCDEVRAEWLEAVSYTHLDVYKRQIKLSQDICLGEKR